MLQKSLKTMLMAAGVLVVSTAAGLGTFAQDTTDVTLTVTAGALTIFAGDDVDNNDICTQTNIDNADTVEVNKASEATATVTCADTEDDVTFGSIAVSSDRQTVSTTINDIVFEDLRGNATANYTITATVSDFEDGAKAITLGANPDTEDSDADADAPGDNTLFAVVDPSGSAMDAIRPGAAETAGVADFSVGSLTTVTKDTTDTAPDVVTLVSTTSAVVAGRYDMDATTFKLRIPAFVEQGSYSGAVTLTIV